MKPLVQTLKALSEPIRLRIIILLQADGELCVCDLMAVLSGSNAVDDILVQAKFLNWVHHGEMQFETFVRHLKKDRSQSIKTIKRMIKPTVKVARMH